MHFPENDNTPAQHHAQSPIEGLAPELMSRIFKFVALSELVQPPAPQESPVPFAQKPSIYTSPLLFGGVCKRWRDIAYASPILWSSLSLCVTTDSTADILAGVQGWLARAGSHPLSLKLEFDVGENITPSTAPLACTILSHFKQCRYLHLNFLDQDNASSSVDGVFRYNDSGFPVLEWLGIWFAPGVQVSRGALTSLLGSTPALHGLVLPCYQGSPSNFPIPFPQFDSAETLPEVLRICPSLENCQFLAQRPSFGSLGHVRHTNLSQLRLGGAHLLACLGALTLPALTALALHGSAGPADQFGSIVSAFLNRSGCNLQDLTLSEVRLSAEELTAVLSLVSPTLKSLRLDHLYQGAVSNALLGRMTYRPDPNLHKNEHVAVLCPYLTRIAVIRFTLPREGYGRAMLDLLESRFRRDLPASGPARIESASISGTFGPPQRRRAKELADQGLDLHITQEGNAYI